MTDPKAIQCVRSLIDFCKEQTGCQNCIFRKYGGDHWGCNISSIVKNPDIISDAMDCRFGKRLHNGWID